MQPGRPSYHVLGPVAVRDGSGAELDLGGAQRRAVLAQLILEPGRVVSASSLGAGIWEDTPPPTWAKAIQVHVSQLRRVLPDGAVVTRAPGYLLDVAGGDTDLGRFEELVAEARHAIDAGRIPAAAAALTEALGLWRGAPLADLADLPLATAVSTRLHEARMAALEDRIGADLALGRHVELVGELEELVAAEPVRERAWAHLMTALYRSGRQADALAAFARARQHLVGEFGLEPGPELRNLEQAILTHAVPAGAEVSLSLTQTRPAPARAPVPVLPERGPVVGRRQAHDDLGEAFAHAAAGRGTCVAVRGDEGLGKTSLVASFAAQVADRATVVAGRAREHAGAVLTPWAEVLRQMGAARELEILEGEPDSSESPEARRQRLFRGVVDQLASEARVAPLVVVMDDLHWADDATVTLLLHATEALADSAVLLVAVWRDREVTTGHPVTALDHHLTRSGATMIDLDPLTRSDVEELLSLLAPAAPEGRRVALARVIHEVTGGVPLFTADLVGTLEADDLPDPRALARRVPDTARTLVARRLTAAGPEVTAVAEVGAVLAEPFSAAVVSALLPDADDARVYLALDGLVRAGLVGHGEGGYAYAHAAYRAAVADTLGPGRRQLMHADALRALTPTGAPATVLAHHSEKAGPLVSDEVTASHLHAAAVAAVERGAFNDAAPLFARAAELLGPASRPAARVRQADALWRAGDIATAKAVAAAVVEAGEGSEADLVDAAVLHGTFGGGFGLDPTSLAVIAQAMAAVTDPQQIARLKVAQAYHHAMWGSPSVVALDAVDQANDALPHPCPTALANEALFAESLALLGSPDLTRRKRVVDELLVRARGDASERDIGRALRMRGLLEMSAGRLADLAATLDELLDVAERSGSWLYRSDAWRWRITAALARGDDGRAADDLAELERISADPLAGRAFVGTQRILVHWARGELDPCLAMLEGMRAVLPDDPMVAPDRRLVDLLRLIVMVEQGRRDEAHDELAPLLGARDEELSLASCRRYTGELAFTARLVAELRLVDLAPSLIDRLTPFRGQMLVLSWGEGILGSADRHLAELRSLVGGELDADGFSEALALEERAGATLEAERTRAALARAEGTAVSGARR